MAIFSNPLNDDFDRHDGAMINYVTVPDQTVSLTARHHYDIRAFHTIDITLPFTQTDYNFWNGYQYNSLGVGNNRSLGGLGGTEVWNTTGGTVTVGKNSSYRYANTISMVIPSGTSASGIYGVTTYGTSAYGSSTIIVSSSFTDDLLTDFNDPNRTYYIELVLRNFPAQSATPHFDLSNSFIDFSTTTNFAVGTVDSIALSSTLNDVSAGGDTFLRFPRTLLRTSTLSALSAIRFRLTAVGGTATFTAQDMRLVDDQYTYQLIDVDTKRKQLTRSIPRAGGTESSSVFGDVYFKGENPKDTTYITQFNAGHNPTGNDNVLRHFFRTQINGDRLEVRLAARDTQSRLSIIQTVSGVSTTLTQTATNSNILATETFYYLITELSGTQMRASIYQRNGITLGSLVYTTGWVTVSITSRGLVGYSFEPYNYDFTVQAIGPQTTSFATFQTKDFNSRKLVRGATLFPTNSTPVNLVSSLTPTAWGDATLAIATDGEITATRTGTLTQGGVRYTPAMFIGDASQLTISGYIWTVQSQGTYRIALVDEVDEVQWLGIIPIVLANQWNYFNLSISPGLIPETSYLHVQQSGSYSGSFILRDINLSYNTIAWSISPDSGTTWQPFLSALGEEYTGAMFSAPTTKIRVQAVATTDQGWISGYQLEPQYTY